MKLSKILSLLVLALALVATPALNAQGVQITSDVQATVGGAATKIIFTGLGSHTRSGVNVIFNVKQLVAATSPLGPLTATLDPARPSDGKLGSTTFPTTHTQNFFLKIKGNSVGTLISDRPLTLSATIQSSPPTATYKSATGSVAFYKEGDPNKTTVLTVNGVTSNVKPAATQTVNVSSVVTASVGTSTTTIQFNGSANNLSSGRNVLFTAKSLTASSSVLGPATATLNSNQTSAGTLSSDTFPTTHTQNFFLQIQSQNLGTLVSDAPIVLTATIQNCPPNAVYRLVGNPVPFYRQGDPTRQTVLTVNDVASTVTPSTGQSGK